MKHEDEKTPRSVNRSMSYQEVDEMIRKHLADMRVLQQ